MNNIRVHIHNRNDDSQNSYPTSTNPLLDLLFGINYILNSDLYSEQSEDNDIDIVLRESERMSSENIAPKSIDDIVFKEYKYTKNLSNISDDSECSICKNEFEQDSYVVKLDCDHIFDVSCIKQWAQYNRNCPMCRKDIK